MSLESNVKIVKWKGYKPYEFQRAVHNELNDGKGSGKIVVVKSHRQCGKSTMIENELLRYAITYDNSVSICISPTLNQSRKVFKDLFNVLDGKSILKSANKSTLEIELSNKSTILLKSAEQKENLRGYTVSGILCIDEAIIISDDIFYLISPFTIVHNAPILITSTPKFKRGFFYDYYVMGKTKDNPNIITIDWNDFDT